MPAAASLHRNFAMSPTRPGGSSIGEGCFLRSSSGTPAARSSITPRILEFMGCIHRLGLTPHQAIPTPTANPVYPNTNTHQGASQYSSRESQCSMKLSR